MLTLAIIGVLCAAELDTSAFVERVVALPPEDCAKLMELAQWCYDSGSYGWAAVCAQRVLQLGDTERQRAAQLLLARSDIGRGEGPRAFEQLRTMAAGGDKEAGALLSAGTTDAVRRQEASLAKAEAAERAREFPEAVKHYKAALDAIPSGKVKAALQSREKVLARLARCNKAAAPAAVDPAPKPDPGATAADNAKNAKAPARCERCVKSKVPGFVVCAACQGRGYVMVKKKVTKRQEREVKETCGKCRGQGEHACGACRGTALELQLKAPAPAALAAFGKEFLERGEAHEGDLTGALRKVEAYVLEAMATKGGRAFFLAVHVPASPRVKALQDALGALPPAPARLLGAAGAWGELNSWCLRAHFLCWYACELARAVEPFVLLGGTSLGGSPALDGAPAASLLEVAAFPDKHRAFVRMEVVLLGVEPAPGDATKARVRFDAGDELGVAGFIWRAEASDALDGLQRAWFGVVGRMSKAYDFGLMERLRGMSSGSTLRVWGRLLPGYDAAGARPLEIWRAEPAVAPEHAAVLPYVTPEVPSFELERVTLATLARCIAVLYGVPVAVEPPLAQAAVAIDSAGAPLGMLLQRVAKAAGGTCYWDGKGYVVALQADAAKVSAFETVMAYVKDVTPRVAVSAKAVR